MDYTPTPNELRNDMSPPSLVVFGEALRILDDLELILGVFGTVYIQSMTVLVHCLFKDCIDMNNETNKQGEYICTL